MIIEEKNLVTSEKHYTVPADSPEGTLHRCGNWIHECSVLEIGGHTE